MPRLDSAKGLIKGAVRRAGYEIARPDVASTMDAALRRLAVRYSDVGTIVDIGASDGRWSMGAIRHFPGVSLLLIEALEDPHGAPLRSLGLPNTHVVIAAAGDRPGSVHFNASDAFGGAASSSSTGDADIIVPMTTVDIEVERIGLRGPFLLKLDTHGFEVAILDGAAATLERTAVIVIEAYNFEIQPGSLTFDEMCRHLGDRGFRVADVVDIMRRPGDQLLWQFDMVFVRRDRPEFQSNSYV
jgi:FkbM family methyltransferase